MKTLIRKLGARLNENFDNVTSFDLIQYSATVNLLQTKQFLTFVAFNAKIKRYKKR